ncbi:MAG: drug/metabolite transporter (DMT)-like permease [Verrucomicrobiales bacterium]|jgi:drug/metabolite transporter (DMT)-like permease
MLLLAGAMVLIPIMDAIAKELANLGMAPASVAFGRFVAQTMVILAVFAIWSRSGNAPNIRPNTLWPNLVRGSLHGGATMMFFVALKYMPLADTIAIFFIEPMVLLLLSSIFLKEVVGWPRRIASLIAFGGAILVIQPSYELFGAISLLPLASACLFAFYLLVTRWVGAGNEHPLTMQLYSGIGAMLAIGPIIIIGEGFGSVDYSISIPTTSGMFMALLAMGFVSSAGHVMVASAFSLAPASVLAPFNYLEIVTATLFGFVFFGDFPGGVQWLGTGIIVSMGFAIFLRERQLERVTASAAGPAPTL